MKNSARSRELGSALLAAALSLLAGCAATVEFGTPPATDALAKLTPKVSTQADVIKALGEPPGRGVVEHRPEERPRKLWFYYFVRSDMSATDQKMLFVFLDGEVYEGHLWFSSLTAPKRQ